jgi:cell division septum initiation protein DivIVA
MASNPTQTVAAAGQSAGQAVGDAFDDARQFAEKAAARTREEAEDILAEARVVAQKDSGRDAAVYVGLAATAALGVVELPLAAALGAGYALFRRRR